MWVVAKVVVVYVSGRKVAQLAFMPHCVDLMSCKLCQVYQTTDGSITN